MPTVVIVHAAEDTLPARALAEKLRQAKLTVVLEKPSGDELRDAIKGAPVTIALWSPRSVQQQTLVDDVGFARGKSKVFHACMQSAPVPDQFRSDKSVNLTGWRGEDDFAPWRELAKLVTDKAGVAPLPPPQARPPSGFFQPGRQAGGDAPAAPAQRGGQQRAAAPPPPRQQQQRPAQQPPPQARPAPQRSAAPAPERKKGGGGLLIGLLALLVIGGGGAAGYYYWSQQQGAAATASAWDSVDVNDAAALRAFLAGDPGEHEAEAQAALTQLEQTTYEAARNADNIEALEAFLNDFPESEHALAVRGRIAELRTLTPATTDEGPTPGPVEPPDPDLVPPGSVTTTPSPDAGGPAPIAPPQEEPTEEPEDAPTN